MSSIHRIIDANVNRAREALRVMEEAARFHLQDRPLTESLKQIRHDLVQAAIRLGPLHADRDVQSDVGATVSTEHERHRDSIHDVVAAASGRLTEALRSIEEYAKLIDPQFATVIESLRYRAYRLEQQIVVRLAASHPRVQWKVCLLLTRAICRNDWKDVLSESLDAGVDCVQLREKELSDAELLQFAQKVMDICRTYSAAVIINDRADVAIAANADGVHLGQGDLPCRDVRRIVGPTKLIGVSTSTLEEARRAFGAGCNYCGVGPMFPTATKHKETIVGEAYLRAYLGQIQRPHLAIGGITPTNVGGLIKAGCRGVAVSSAICSAERPGEVARLLVDSFMPPRCDPATPVRSINPR